MTEKWTKSRCERELKNPENWIPSARGFFIQESEFEFYSVTFVKINMLMASYDYESRKHDGSFNAPNYIGKWVDSRTIHRIVRDEYGTAIGMESISQLEAVNYMMKALKEEGLI